MDVVQRLLGVLRTNINLQDALGKTALMVATEQNHPEIVKLLLDANAKPDLATHSGKTPLLMAASFGNVQCMQHLLHSGAKDADFKVDINQLLITAASNGQEKVVSTLLEMGADPTKIDHSHGMTVLSAAANRGHLAVIQVIYQHLLKTLSTQEMMQFVNWQNENGSTALHLASCGGHEEVIRYLMDTIKVDIDLKDHSNKSALEYCMTMGPSYKVLYAVSLWSHEHLTSEQYPSDPKLRKKLAKLFDRKKKDISKTKVVKEDTGFKIIFGVVLSTMARDTSCFENMFAEMIRDGRFQDVVRGAFHLTMPMGVLEWKMQVMKKGTRKSMKGKRKSVKGKRKSVKGKEQ